MMKLIQHTAVVGVSGTSSSITLPRATLARSLIVVMEVNASNGAITSITDNSPTGTSLYTSVANATRSGTERLEMWNSANSHGAATQITLNFNATITPVLWVFEVQVIDSTTPLTQSNTTSNGASTLTPLGPSVTTTDPLEFLASVISVGATVTSVNAPWTIGDIVSGDADSYLITTYRGIGTFAPTYTTTASGTFSSITAAFREAPHSTDLRTTSTPPILQPSTAIPDYYEG